MGEGIAEGGAVYQEDQNASRQYRIPNKGGPNIIQTQKKEFPNQNLFLNSGSLPITIMGNCNI